MRSRLALAVCGLLVAAQSAAYLAAPSLTGEGGALDWLSVAALALAAAAAARTGRRGLAAALAFLAVDDAAGLHERVTAATGTALGVHWGGDVLFLVPYLPLLAFVAVALWGAARHGGAAIRTGVALLAASTAIRLAGALALLAGATLHGWERRAAGAAIHDAELAAWLLLAAGLLAAQTARTSARTPSAFSDSPISPT
jgi:hypothetical protein